MPETLYAPATNDDEDSFGGDRCLLTVASMCCTIDECRLSHDYRPIISVVQPYTKMLNPSTTTKLLMTLSGQGSIYTVKVRPLPSQKRKCHYEICSILDVDNGY